MTKRTTHRIGLFCVFFLLNSLFSQTVFAHELEQASAQIILRDGQVELRVYINTEHWLEELQDPTAWLTAESDFLFLEASTDQSFSELGTNLSDYLRSEVDLQLDNQPLSLVAVNQHSIGEKIEQEGTHQLTEFRFSAQHTDDMLQRIDVQFPESLGAVQVSVVQPLYGLIPAGAVGTFSIGSK